MPNRDGAFGLRAARHLNGGVVRHNDYRIADGLASDIFYGDPVKTTGTGKNITPAAAGDVMVGVFVGCRFVKNPGGEPTWSKSWPSGQALQPGTVAVAYVYDDPNILFEIQADEDIEAADIGHLADLVINAGDAATQDSRVELDSSTIAGGGAEQLKIYELVDRPDNEFGNFAKVHVLLNQHELRPGTMAGV